MGVMPGPCVYYVHNFLLNAMGNDRESKSNEIDYKTVFFVFLVAFKEGRLHVSNLLFFRHTHQSLYPLLHAAHTHGVI